MLWLGGGPGAGGCGDAGDDDGGGLCDRRIRKAAPKPIRPSAANPPTAPPTMGAMGGEDEDESGELVGLCGVTGVVVCEWEDDEVEVELLLELVVEEDELVVVVVGLKKTRSLPAVLPHPNRL